MIPQDETERILADRLKELGGTVRRGVTVTAVDQDASGVRVRYSAADGDHVAQARYVVGADGMHSLVRTASAISFEGGTYEESFILADVKMQWPLGTDEVSLFFSPEGLVVIAPLPDGNFRVVAIMEGAPEQPTVRDVQGLIDRRGPTSGICRVEKVVWSSRFRIHHRVVNTYRDGRLYLMGDAAHVHSPAGGQGMNTGLVDAVVLAKVLVKAVKDGATKEVVEAYSRLRRPAAVEVLGLAGRLTNMATTRGSLKRRVRNLMLRLLNAVPAAKRRLVLNLSGLARRRYADSV
jgi:2-polyprenyl-6-methoxyphenol hydroxylase-like FAD-dependent oxidoreductase